CYPGSPLSRGRTDRVGRDYSAAVVLRAGFLTAAAVLFAGALVAGLRAGLVSPDVVLVAPLRPAARRGLGASAALVSASASFLLATFLVVFFSVLLFPVAFLVFLPPRLPTCSARASSRLTASSSVMVSGVLSPGS